jgi:thiol-disulfide isomerase/thioredoxin
MIPMNRRLALLSLLVVLAAAASAHAQDNSSVSPVLNGTVKQYLFWRDGCPHCEAERGFLDELKGKYPELAVFEYEVGDKDNQALYVEFAKRYNTSAQYVPATFIGDKSIMGFNNKYLIGRDIENAIRREIDRANNRTTNDTGDSMVYIPFVGEFDPNSVSLPVLTVVLGGKDSINPCAFFILLFLLSLMVHAQSRTRMFIIGGIFVFFSGLIYFLFMAAWLNLFLVIGQVALITTVAGLIALVIGVILFIATLVPLWTALLITGAVLSGTGVIIAHMLLSNKVVLKTPIAVEMIKN